MALAETMLPSIATFASHETLVQKQAEMINVSLQTCVRCVYVRVCERERDQHFYLSCDKCVG